MATYPLSPLSHAELLKTTLVGITGTASVNIEYIPVICGAVTTIPTAVGPAAARSTRYRHHFQRRMHTIRHCH
eukprot:SAG11_NODE_347_length_10420_cov_5.267997_1_plen_73_part_00